MACTIKHYSPVKYSIFCSKLVYFILAVTSSLALTNTLAYYEICTLQIRNVFIVQGPGACTIKLFTAVIVAVL